MHDETFKKEQLLAFEQRIEERLKEIKAKKIFGCAISETQDWLEDETKTKNVFRPYKKRIAPGDLEAIYTDALAYIRTSEGSTAMLQLAKGEAQAFGGNRNKDSKDSKIKMSRLTSYGILFDNFKDIKEAGEFQFIAEPKSNRARTSAHTAIQKWHHHIVLSANEISNEERNEGYLYIYKYNKNLYTYKKNDTNLTELNKSEQEALENILDDENLEFSNHPKIVQDPQIVKQIVDACHFSQYKYGKEGKVRPAIRIDCEKPERIVTKTQYYKEDKFTHNTTSVLANKEESHKEEITKFHSDIVEGNNIARKTNQWYGAVTKPYIKPGNIYKVLTYFPAASKKFGPDLKYFLHNLSSLLQKKYITLGDCISILYQTIAQLEQTHKINGSHGDIAPRNILIDGKGKIKIGDFSINSNGSYHFWSPEKWLWYWQLFRSCDIPDLENLTNFAEYVKQKREITHPAATKQEAPIKHQAAKGFDDYVSTHLLKRLGATLTTYQRIMKPLKYYRTTEDDIFAAGYVLLEFKKELIRSNNNSDIPFNEQDRLRLNSFIEVLDQLLGDSQPTKEQQLLHTADALTGHHLFSPSLNRMGLEEVLATLNQYLHVHINKLTFSSHLETEKYIKDRMPSSLSYPHPLIRSPLISAFDAVDHYLTKTTYNPLTDECYQDWCFVCHMIHTQLTLATDETLLFEQRKRIFPILNRSINHFANKNIQYTQLLINICRLIHDEKDTSRKIYLSLEEVQLFNKDLQQRISCYHSRLQLGRDVDKLIIKYDDCSTQTNLPPYYLPTVACRLHCYQQNYRAYQAWRAEKYPLQPSKIARANDTVTSYTLLFRTMSDVNNNKILPDRKFTPSKLNSLITSIQCNPVTEAKAIRTSHTYNIRPQYPLTKATDKVESRPEIKNELKEDSILPDSLNSFNPIMQTIIDYFNSPTTLSKSRLRQNAHWLSLCHLLTTAQTMGNLTENKLEGAKQLLLNKLHEGRRRFRTYWPWSQNTYVRELAKLEAILSPTAEGNLSAQNNPQDYTINLQLFKMCDDYFERMNQDSHEHYSLAKHKDYFYILKFILINIQTQDSKDPKNPNKQIILDRLQTSINQFNGRYQVCLEEIRNAIANDDLLLTAPELKTYLESKIQTQSNLFLQPFTNIDRYLERRIREIHGDNTVFFNSQDAMSRQHSYLKILQDLQRSIKEGGDNLRVLTPPPSLQTQQAQFSSIFKRQDYADCLTALQVAFTNKTVVNDQELQNYLTQQIHYYTNALRKSCLLIFDHIEDFLQQTNTSLTLNIQWKIVLDQIHTAGNNEENISSRITTLLNEATITPQNEFFYRQLRLLQHAFSANGYIDINTQEFKTYSKQQRECYRHKNILVAQLKKLLEIQDPKDWERFAIFFKNYNESYQKYLDLRAKLFSNNIDRPSASEIVCDPYNGNGLLLQVISQHYPQLSLEHKRHQAQSIWASLLATKAKLAAKLIEDKEVITEEKLIDKNYEIESKIEKKEIPILKAMHEDDDKFDHKLLVKTEPITSSSMAITDLIMGIINTESKRLKQQKEGYCCFLRPSSKATADIKILEDLTLYHLQLPTLPIYPDFLEDNIIKAINKINDLNTRRALESCLPHFRQTQLTLLRILLLHLRTHQAESKLTTTIQTHIKNLQMPGTKPLNYETMQQILTPYQQNFANIPISALSKEALQNFLEVAEVKAETVTEYTPLLI